MAAHSVQEPVTGRDTHPAPPLGHGRAQRPLVGVRVETLDGSQTRAAVPSSHSVKAVGLVFSETSKNQLN